MGGGGGVGVAAKTLQANGCTKPLPSVEPRADDRRTTHSKMKGGNMETSKLKKKEETICPYLLIRARHLSLKGSVLLLPVRPFFE